LQQRLKFQCEEYKQGEPVFLLLLLPPPRRQLSSLKAFFSVCAIIAVICLFYAEKSHAFYPISSREEKAKNNDYTAPPKIDYGTGTSAALIKKGEYLARAGDCIACHTDTEHKGIPFSGGLAIKTPFGTFYTPNITSDKETGLGAWTFTDFERAMKEGLNPKHQPYFPVFPYMSYTKVSRNDLEAIWAYLQKIPPVKKANKDNTLPFPVNWRFLQTGYRLLFFYGHRGDYQYDASRSPEWNRGAYLVQGLGHCGMCHTPMNIFGAWKQKYYLTGGFIDGFWAPNITRYGLETVSPEAIVKVFKNDALPHEAGVVARPMAEVNHDSLMHLTDADLYAIATYLKTVDTQSPTHTISPMQKPFLGKGRLVYFKACAQCHAEGKAGAPLMGDGNNWFDRVQKKRLHTLYRHTIDGYNNMPIKGNCQTCSNQDIEDAVNYILYKSLSPSQKKELQKPIAPRVLTLADGKALYEQHCALCHQEGKLNSPVTGNKEVWAPLIAKGMDQLLNSVIKGKGAMPPNGGCEEYCSTNELKAALVYMIEQSKTSGDYTLWLNP